MQTRKDPKTVRFQFHSAVGQPPYTKTGMRTPSGLKQTSFFSTIGAIATDYKLHNSYLKPDFFTDPVEEYWAIRETAGLLDVTGEEVIEVRGPDALALLNDLMPRDVRKLKDGTSFYSVLCHDTGGIVEDGILARFDESRFWWIGGPGNSEECLYINGAGRDVTIEGFNHSLHVASLQGPKSREMLQAVCDADLSLYPVFALFDAKVCGVPVTITRTGYTAELGYDIYVDIEYGAAFFAELWAHVQRHDGKLCGSKTLNLRRVEAGILNFGQDFDWQHTPVEIGLGWMINDRKGPFRSREALLARKEKPPASRITGFRMEGDEVPLIGDPVLAGDKVVGRITSPIASPAFNCPIAIGWLEGEVSNPEVLCADRRLKATAVELPFLDPERRLMRM